MQTAGNHAARFRKPCDSLARRQIGQTIALRNCESLRQCFALRWASQVSSPVPPVPPDWFCFGFFCGFPIFRSSTGNILNWVPHFWNLFAGSGARISGNCEEYRRCLQILGGSP